MSRPQPYYAQPSSSAPTEDDAASEYSCSSYSTDRPTAAQPPAQQPRPPDSPSEYSYYSDSYTKSGPDRTSSAGATKATSQSRRSIAEWISQAGAALGTAANPAEKDDVPRGFIYTPREAPLPRKRAGRNGRHGRIASIPWRELVGLKESLLSQMDGTAAAEVRRLDRDLACDPACPTEVPDCNSVCSPG